MKPEGYLTTAQVAEALGITSRAVQRYIDRGHFPGAYKLDPTRSNSPYRIPKKDLEAFLKKQRGRSKAD